MSSSNAKNPVVNFFILIGLLIAFIVGHALSIVSGLSGPNAVIMLLVWIFVYLIAFAK